MNVLLILPEAENPRGVYESALRAAFPDVVVNSVDHHDKVGPYIGSADVLMTFSPFMADHVVREGTRLQWIQVLGSGVDGFVNLPSLRRDVLITNGRGVQATPVSEAALSLMLALARDMPRMLDNQAARRWQRWPSQLLDGCTLGILGVGQIGEALALKAQALGMRVTGVSSATRGVAGFDRMYPRERLGDAVGEMDFFVVLTPYSADTHHIVDGSVLERMKPEAFLVNLARGGVVNETDLVRALRDNRIRGAALDVFEQEPLPSDSELWSLPNVIISPHLGGLNSSYPRSILPLVIDNVSRFRAGQRDQMRNVVTYS